uniref:MotB1,Motility protein B n=2 Tax=Bacteria TaxID=2 RepID=UPI003BEF4C58
MRQRNRRTRNVKSAHSSGSPHDRWMITYADLITLLLIFFVMMYAMSRLDASKYEEVTSSLQTTFQSSSGILDGGNGVIDYPSGQNGNSSSEANQPGSSGTGSDMGQEADGGPLTERESRLRKLRGDLDQLIESDPKLRALRPHLKIDLVQEGLRIQIIDSQNRPMFRTGSADVEPYMRDILRAIAPVLNGIPNRISLSGHTDDFPYASGEKGYSNWELSADRANASRRELMVGGLDSGKVLRVVGMAATMRLSDRGPDDAVNRRISLLVLNKQAEQAILHENAESQNEPVSALEKPEVAPQVSVPTMPSAEPRHHHHHH